MTRIKLDLQHNRLLELVFSRELAVVINQRPLAVRYEVERVLHYHPKCRFQKQRVVRFDHFKLKNVTGRLARMKLDPWAEMAKSRPFVSAAMQKSVGYRVD